MSEKKTREKIKLLMVGVDKSTGGGMWTVAENYIRSSAFRAAVDLTYIPSAVTGSIPKRLLFTARAYIRILIRLMGDRYDILHVHMAEKGSVYRKAIVMCMAKLFRCRILLHMHGAEFEDWYRHSGALNRRFVQRILNTADRVVILGRYWEGFLSSLLRAPEKLSVVYNAVPVPEKRQYNRQAKNFLFLGVAGKRKGIPDLLSALKCADRELDRDVRLIICGPDETGVEEEIRQIGLSHRAEYRGRIPAEERDALFSDIAVNVLPSYHEGLPMTILETMAYGIPNIATAVAAVPEAVDAGNGILITPGDVRALTDALILLSSDEELRLKKSVRAYETARQKFSLDGHITEIIQRYRELEQMK